MAKNMAMRLVTNLRLGSPISSVLTATDASSYDTSDDAPDSNLLIA